MSVHANVMVKDEAIILPHVYKYWKDYPIDLWVFYDDNSTDSTVETIQDLFGNKAVVISDKLDKFSESHNRSRMFEYSREKGAKYIVSIDADELMTANMVKEFHNVLSLCDSYDTQFFWYNTVGDVNHYRADPMYENNYRTFICKVSKSGKFDLSQFKYHTPRTPPVAAIKGYTSEFGFIHLQSINRRYYALKQLWYKHYEYHTWRHPIDFINQRYDPVVNNLNFLPREMKNYHIDGIEFPAAAYNEIAKAKGYKQYILDNYVPELITFGGEYLDNGDS